jgi:hypothetical protein
MLGLGLACGGDPLAQDAAAYNEAMSPVLAENMELAQEFLEVAAQIKRKQVGAEELNVRWEESVLPMADGLYEDARAVQPQTPDLAALHASLVESWGDRAEAYHQMHRAYKRSDSEGFQSAFEKNIESKIAEEEYFRGVNVLLEPYGYHLDQFP